MILKWRILSATNDLDRVSAVALPKLPISISNTDLKVAADTKFCPGLGKSFILLWDHSITLNVFGVIFFYDFTETQM